MTGSAKQRVTSDSVKWTGEFSRTVPEAELKAGYAQMKDDQAKVEAFLKSEGLAAADIDISPVQLEAPFKYNYNNNYGPKEYILRQTVRVQSADVGKITELAKNTALVEAGLIFASLSLEYYYTDLAALRVSLLSEAVKDAQARATKIAESTGRKVGTLKSASMGVVQVMQINSVDVSDYGAYDTSTIEKEVMVTVKTSFVMN